MSRTHLFLGLCLLMFVTSLVGCATPDPLVSLRPVNADVVWVAGRASVQKQDGEVRVATAFEHQDGATLAIRVEVENHSVEPMVVSPDDVTFVTCTGQSCTKSRRVIDPETMLLTLDETEARESAQTENQLAVAAPLLLLGAMADVATVASGKGGGTTGLRTSAIANSMQNDIARHDRSMATISTKRHVWSNVALRRTTLSPGAAYGGLVYVPIDMNAATVWLYIRPGGRSGIPFTFTQVVRQVPELVEEPPAHSTR